MALILLWPKKKKEKKESKKGHANNQVKGLHLTWVYPMVLSLLSISQDIQGIKG